VWCLAGFCGSGLCVARESQHTFEMACQSRRERFGRGAPGTTPADSRQDSNVAPHRRGLQTTGRPASSPARAGPRDRPELLYNGEPIENAGDFCVPPRCAYTVQVPRLFSDSLRDNVLMGMDRSDGQITDALQAAVME